MISSAADEGILTVFKETRGLRARAQNLTKRFWVGLPIHRKALEVLEYRPDAGSAKRATASSVVLVEVGIENALVHEVRVAIDREQQPAQIVQFERRQNAGWALTAASMFFAYS